MQGADDGVDDVVPPVSGRAFVAAAVMGSAYDGAKAEARMDAREKRTLRRNSQRACRALLLAAPLR